MRPGFTARLSEPPACSVFDPRPDALESIVSHSPATPFGARRVNAQDASSIPASSRSRKLGTAFRSPVTTLSPPLRGQRSRPAPSFPRQRTLRTRSTEGSSARFGFEAKPGEFFTFNPLSAPISGAVAMSSDLHSPSGNFQPSGSKRSTGFITNKLALPNARLFFAPRFALFRLRPGSALQTRLRPARLIVP